MTDQQPPAGKGQPPSAHGPRAHEFALERSDFDELRRLLYDHAGIQLADYKMDMVYSRLARRLRDRKLGSFKAYVALLRVDADEFVQFINAMTTNLTAFFREKHHFDYLQQHTIPQFHARGRHQIRAWSAGCSFGAEPYTLAMTLRSHPRIDTRQWDIRITASDIDTRVLKSAEDGVYDEMQVLDLPADLRQRWFWRGKGGQSGKVKVKDELRHLIDFRAINLIKHWDLGATMHFIFCRNVMIYFDNATQERLLNHMADSLEDGGLLFVGHSEAPGRLTDRFELIGKTIYRKRY
ncbi:CheR family methyltransferase [Pokkaliibacter sp. CJK22405]|uniref:CheR family methyltransferase n=1 Tax=Pokkaliibacter sp. CJK22405 TaxID=3384615 RepID=UPI003984AA28